jgi:hypothetical protein
MYLTIGNNESHKKIYSYRENEFTCRANSIRITGDPDNQRLENVVLHIFTVRTICVSRSRTTAFCSNRSTDTFGTVSLMFFVVD